MKNARANDESVPSGVARSLRRRMLFRVGALLVGCLMVAAAELLLWGLEFPRVEQAADPFVGFHAVQPLFELDEQGVRRVADAKRRFFRAESFLDDKPDGQFRIFVLGGSTVQGRPYAIETAFSTWLELQLQAAEPALSWQVVNCGGVSYASYRLVPLMREVLQYQPDLVVIYTGHNEFLEARSYEHVPRDWGWIQPVYRHAARWRLYQLAHGMLHSSSPAPTVNLLNSEVDALLDYQGGLAKYHRDPAWRSAVVVHFEANLRRLCRLAADASVPVVLVDPVENLRDTPPFKSVLPRDWTDQQRREFETAWEQAKSSDWNQLEQKATLVRRTLRLDPEYAAAWYLLAKVLEAENMPIDDSSQRAAEAYQHACDFDVCPLRMLSSMHAIVRNVARETRTPLVEARRALQATAEIGVLGDDQLADHVHPDIPAHRRIADLLFWQLVEMQHVRPQPGWRQRQQILDRQHLHSLPPTYYTDGLSRLEGLKRWTQGRVRRLRDSNTEPASANGDN